MQTAQQQQQTNIIRLEAYRAKQTDDQRRRALVAEQVSAYSKKIGLNIAQTAPAIKIALKQLEYGYSDEAAYQSGSKAAHTIALVSANEKLRRVRSYIRLH